MIEETNDDHSDVWVFSKTKQEWIICKVVADNVDEGIVTIIDDSNTIQASSSSSTLSNMQHSHAKMDSSKGHQQILVRKSDICVVDPTHLQDLSDLSAMNNLHEAPLINILRKRWFTSRIYTAASDVLISVNPYKTIPGLYDNPSSYFSFPMQGQEFNEDSYLESMAQMSPHVYLIANRALRSLLKPDFNPGAPTNQSVIISGESGAGKTEASKHVVNFLIQANHQFSMSLSFRALNDGNSSFLLDKVGIKNLILKSSIIFEAFGNAKTVRNDNSSRFGKYIKLQYSPTFEIVSAATETFLLEKSRLVNVGENERNYHVFYQMLSGMAELNPNLHAELGLLDISRFKILTMGNCTRANDDVDDAVEFKSLYQALISLETTEDLLKSMWMVLASVLHLGNANVTEPSVNGAFCSIALSSTSMSTLATMLGVNDVDLTKALVSSTFRSGKVRGSVHVKTLSAMESLNNINALMKWLYYQVFTWLVNTINNAHSRMNMQSADENDEELKYIGILDIFGFEILTINSFEQLCINYTNERLQQQFNEYVFLSEQDLYAKEGLDWTSISYKDNQHIIDLIAKKPVGLLLVLEEHGMMNRAPDDAALLNSLNQHHDKHEAYIKSKFAGDGFSIKHFAGVVQYKIHGFLNKNNNSLQEDLNMLLATSTNSMLHQILDGSNSSGHEEVGGLRENLKAPEAKTRKLSASVTVSLQFRGQLDTLIKTLRETHPHYIKCLKPNESKKNNIFDWSLVATQLRYSGALEVVRIRREGYPIRLTFFEFYRKYYLTITQLFQRLYPNWKKNEHDCGIDELKLSCSTMLKLCLRDLEYQIGHSMIFLRENGFIDMQKAIKRLYRTFAIRIQSKYRSHHMSCIYQRILKAIFKLQPYLRMLVAYRKYTRFHHAVSVLQRAYKYKIWRRITLKEYFIFRVEFDKKQRRIRAQVKIAAMYRMHHDQKVFNLYRNAMIILQAHQRGYIARRRLRIQRNANSIVQHGISKLYRGRRERRKYLHTRGCVIRVQSYIRRFLAQKVLSALREKYRIKCGTKIQLFASSHQRGFVARKPYKIAMQNIIISQAVARKYLAGLELSRRREEKIIKMKTFIQLKLSSKYRSKKQQQAYQKCLKRIILIQSLIRRRMAVKVLKRLKLQKQNAAAVVIEKFTSSHYLRRVAMFSYRKLKLSSIKVQAAFRKYLAIRLLHSMRHEYKQCVRIQSLYRQHRANKFYQEVRVKIIRIQTRFRCWRKCMKYQLFKQCACHIQKNVRGYLTRKKVFTMIWLIINLQKLIRGKLVRRQFQRQRSAVKLIQRIGRGYIARKYVRHSISSITKIQSVFRMKLALNKYNGTIFYVLTLQAYIRKVGCRLQYLRQRQRIMKIQSHIRKHLACKHYAYARHMVIRLQAVTRSWNAIRRFQMSLYYIITIQTQIRKTIEVLRYQRTRNKIITIQSLARKFLGLKHYRFIISRIILIQSIARAYNQRRRYDTYLFFCIMLQTCIRRYICMKSYEKARASCIRIQTFVRCRFVKYAYKYMRFSATKITSVIRMFLAKRLLSNLKYLRDQASRLQRFFRSLVRKLKLYHFQELLYLSLREPTAVSSSVISNLLTTEIRTLRNKWRGYETVFHAACQSDRKDNLVLLNPTAYDLLEYDISGGTCLHSAMSRIVDIDTVYEIFRVLDTYKYIPLTSVGGDEAIVFGEGDSDDGANEEDDKLASLHSPDSPYTSKTTRSSTIISNIAEFVSNSNDPSLLVSPGHSDGHRGSVDNEMTILKQGFLRKKGENLGFWQKRWFILTDRALHIYGSSSKPKNLEKPRMKITLYGCQINRILTGGKQSQPIFEVNLPNATERRNFFGKVIQKKTLLFQAADEKDLQDWLCPVKAVAGMTTFRETAVNFVQLDLHELVVNMTTYGSETPLHVLLKSFHRHTSSYMKNTNTGRSQIIYELRKRVLILASWLIDKGCSLDARDRDGYTAMDLCRIYQYTEFIQYIEGIKVYLSIRRHIPRLRGYSYVNIFYSSMKMNLHTPAGNAVNYSSSVQPRLRISVYNQKGQAIEDAIDLGLPAVKESSEFWWGTSWHMQSPLENIQPDTVVITEFFQQPGILTAWNRFDFNTDSIDSGVVDFHLRKPPMLWDGAGSTSSTHSQVIGMLNARIMISRKVKSFTIDDVKKQQAQAIKPEELNSPIMTHRRAPSSASSYRANLSPSDLLIEEMTMELSKNPPKKSVRSSIFINRASLLSVQQESKAKYNPFYKAVKSPTSQPPTDDLKAFEKKAPYSSQVTVTTTDPSSSNEISKRQGMRISSAGNVSTSTAAAEKTEKASKRDGIRLEAPVGNATSAVAAVPTKKRYI